MSEQEKQPSKTAQSSEGVGRIERLNDPDLSVRLDTLSEIDTRTQKGELPAPPQTPFVNNHIHTTYSFSPYSPTMALYRAWQSGLKTAGIMDHDSVGGAREFLRAGEILHMPVTTGMELRVQMAHTPLGMRRLNNPDQVGVAYVAMHGIPHDAYDTIASFMAPYRAARNRRNQIMVERLNDLLSPLGLEISFENDVLPLSLYNAGGSVTERHLLFALAKKICARFDDPAALCTFLQTDMALLLSEKVRENLMQNDPAYTAYDVLGVLKSELIGKIYVDAHEELPRVEDFVALCRETGAISAYAYLGDVGDSVTGDKKAQQFEDAYLPLLFDTIKNLGFQAVTYMPTRNTPQQLQRVMEMCARDGFFEISGEDINSPRQSFVCKKLTDPAFTHLIDATYALIGHERAATMKREDGMFSPKTMAAYPALSERIVHFAEIGRE